MLTVARYHGTRDVYPSISSMPKKRTHTTTLTTQIRVYKFAIPISQRMDSQTTHNDNANDGG